MSDSAVNAATNGFVADGAHRIRVSVMIRARRWEAYLVIPLGTLESRVGPVRALRTGNPERGGHRAGQPPGRITGNAERLATDLTWISLPPRANAAG